ncbi:MAG: cupin domain-containing protein [bacterium]
MTANVDYLRKWPVDGAKSRREKRLVVIKQDNHLHLIHGQKRHVLVSIIVSNDYLSAGLLTIPVGGYSEMEIHSGDETLYALEGDLTVRTIGSEEKEDEKSATHMSHLVEQGEKMLIPEGTRHQYLNFTNAPLRMFFAVAPKL